MGRGEPARERGQQWAPGPSLGPFLRRHPEGRLEPPSGSNGSTFPKTPGSQCPEEGGAFTFQSLNSSNLPKDLLFVRRDLFSRNPSLGAKGLNSRRRSSFHLRFFNASSEKSTLPRRFPYREPWSCSNPQYGFVVFLY